MLYRLGADLVLIAHFVFVAFAVLGAFALRADPRWAWIHVPVVIWSSLVNLAGWTCPLTPLENRLRRQGGQHGYAGGFVQHYLGPLVYPRGMPRRLELVAGVSIVVWNALLYAVLLW
jgi:hypothetical protein